MTPSPFPAGDLSRRAFLAAGGRGLAGLGLLSLLQQHSLLAQQEAAASGFLRPAKAKRCIFLFMFGGPAPMDLFDYKPQLQRSGGKSVRLERRRGDVAEGTLLASERSFQRYGETGQWCSDALPNIARHMDKLAVVKSMVSSSFAHGSALLEMNSGQILQGHPSMGSWISYGIGTQNEDLPGFVVMQDPRGGPISGPSNWSSAYLPASHQGTLFRASGDPLLDMSPTAHPAGRAQMTRAMLRDQIETLNALNAIHAAERPSSAEPRARMSTYELAYRMQERAPEVLDLSGEDESTRALYGLDLPRGEHPLTLGPAPFGRQCLIARRLVERGVRFVQIYHGGGHQQQTWDAHGSIEENLAIHCPEIDVPIAGLLTDLERRGLLSETLVVWGGEFGRMPTTQGAVEFQVASSQGRDHNPKGFTVWLAGAGIKPGSHGETDELGAEAAIDPHPLRDLHATILHLMGIDHERLTYPYGGLDRRLTGVQAAEPIHAILA